MHYQLDTSNLPSPSPFSQVINAAAAEVVEQINQSTLPEHSVTITVTADPANVIPETGSGGWTESPENIWVYIDPDNDNFQSAPKERVKSAVAHELGHAFRERTVSFPGTLLDDLVAEGIADHFDIRFAGSKHTLWSTALSESERTTLYEQATPLFFMRSHDYAAWFMGSPELGIPKWGGYALGFHLVATYLQQTEQEVEQVIALPSEEFLRP